MGRGVEWVVCYKVVIRRGKRGKELETSQVQIRSSLEYESDRGRDTERGVPSFYFILRGFWLFGQTEMNVTRIRVTG